VTRLGDDFSPIGRMFTLGSFMKIQEVLYKLCQKGLIDEVNSFSIFQHFHSLQFGWRYYM
jgi:hypothetical protein